MINRRGPTKKKKPPKETQEKKAEKDKIETPVKAPASPDTPPPPPKSTAPASSSTPTPAAATPAATIPTAATPPKLADKKTKKKTKPEEITTPAPDIRVTPSDSPSTTTPKTHKYNVRKGKLETEVDEALDDFGGGGDPPLRSSTPDDLNDGREGSPTSPKTPLSPDSADTSGLDEDSTLEPARTLFTQTSLVDSVLEEVNDGGDINRSLRNHQYIRDDWVTHHILSSVDKLIFIVGNVNKCSNQCLALQDTISVLEPLCSELEVQWRNLSRRKRRHLDLYLSCIVQWLDVVEQVLNKCAVDLPKYQVFHHLLRAVKGVGFRKKLVDANLKIKSAEQHLVTAMITCNLQVSGTCRGQVFEDVRLILEDEGTIIKKQLNDTAQELYGKQLQMERKIIRKLAKKEKKKRAAVNQADGDETVSAEVPERVEDLIIDTQVKQELATIGEEEEEPDENDNSETVSHHEKANGKVNGVTR